MKREPWLVPYSHDHQHGLAQALRLRNAAQGEDPAMLATRVEEALAFADGELAAHMAAEESELLPLVAQLGCLDAEDAERVAAEHLQLRTLRNSMQLDPSNAVVALRFAELLHDHVRWEERHLFQRWQQRLARFDATVVQRAIRHRGEPESSHALAAAQQAPGANGIALGSLNATNVMLAPGGSIQSASIDRDIAYVVIDGTGTLVARSDGERVEHELVRGTTIVLARGSDRELLAGADGLRFTTVHVRRGRLDVRPAAS